MQVQLAPSPNSEADLRLLRAEGSFVGSPNAFNNAFIDALQKRWCGKTWRGRLDAMIPALSRCPKENQHQLAQNQGHRGYLRQGCQLHSAHQFYLPWTKNPTLTMLSS